MRAGLARVVALRCAARSRCGRGRKQRTVIIHSFNKKKQRAKTAHSLLGLPHVIVVGA